jgi:hypothetical protein
MKRTTDVVGAVTALVLGLPLLAVVSLAILIESPGPLLYRANRVGQGGRPLKMLKFRKQIGVTGRLAVLVFPTISAAVPPNVEPFTLPSTALVTAEVANNEFRNHQEVPFGIGVRVAAIGPGAPNVEGMARVTVRDNDLSDNRFGVVAEAGFLVANTAQRGSIELTLNGNAIAGSCQVGLLVALNSQATAIASGSGLSTRNSTYTIHLGDNIAWSDAWYSHPAGTGSSLTVDGEIVENGSRVSYDAKGC